MKFAIINDMHISSADTGFELGVQRKLTGQSERLVKEFVGKMNTQEHPEFVVNLGDSIEDVKNKKGDTFYFKKAVELLSHLKMPVYYLIGNHDIKTLTDAEIAKLLGYRRMYYSFDSDGYHFIVLSFEQRSKNNSDLSDIDRIVPQMQLDWLIEGLKATEKPTIVFSHYGLADDDMVGNFWFEKIPDKAVIKNRHEVRQILEKSGNVKAVISAHQHWNRMLVHNNIPYYTVTSLVENFNNDGVAAEAYTIVSLTKNKIMVEVKGNDPAKFEFEFK